MSRFRSRTDGLRAAKRIEIDGIKFASKREAERYGQLRLLKAAGLISNLACHTRHKLIVNGIKVTTYIDDFSYNDDNGRRVIEDVKPVGFITDSAKFKIALFNAIHHPEGLQIEIVEMK